MNSLTPSLQEKALAEKEKRRRQAARQNEGSLTFREFIALVNPRFRFYLHCEVLINVLQRVADGEIKRLMVFMPPRHGKSEMISRLFAAYYLFRFPHRWVGVNSYGADLAYTMSRAARENFERAGGRMKSDAAAVKHWETTGGGGFWAAGVGGPITGKGWHLGIIDDPLKNAEEAASETVRNAQKEWYGSTFYTREEPVSETDASGALIVLLTRWNEDDLAGYLLQSETGEEPEKWHIVSLEAIKEGKSPEFPPTCTVEPDWRQAGEALCPERRPLEKLKKIAARIGDYFWNALFQQNPQPKTGAFFNVEKLKVEDAIPADALSVRGWDKAATHGDGDFTAGVKMAANGDGFFYIVDVVAGQWDTATRDANILQTAELDGRAVPILGEQEPGSGGKDAAAAFIRLLAGFSVRVEKSTANKAERADPLSSQINAGNVRLIRGDWNRAFIEELRSFPRGKHDDKVDGASLAFNFLAKISGKVSHGESLW